MDAPGSPEYRRSAGRVRVVLAVRSTLRHAQGKASTEDLRQAMIHYRALFDELVNETEAPASEKQAEVAH